MRITSPEARRARMLPRVLLVLAALVAAACQADSPPEDPETVERDDAGNRVPKTTPTPAPTPAPTPTPAPEPAVPAYGVSAGHPDAVEVGMRVLAEGGNAVDAAVATAYAVSVVEPFGSGVGGGGMALVAEPGEAPVAFDYREVVRDSGEVPSTETGIPGFVAGMEALHAAHGSADLADLIAPAVTLAADGTEASAMLTDRLQAAAGRLPVADLPQLFPDGAALAPGAPLVQEELATTLQQIADGGAAAFYEGRLGELAQRADGVDVGSLAAYEVERSSPPAGRLGDLLVVSAAPPLPGASLIQLVQVADALGVSDHDPGTAEFVHAVAMSWRVAERFFLDDVADPAFADVPLDDLTDPRRNAALAARVPDDALLALTEGEPYGGLDPDPERTDTTHISVVDTDVRVVSMTNTLSNFWGSGQYALGFFPNDQLRYFQPPEGTGHPPEPGKRPVAYSTPTILFDADDRPLLAVGSPGGRRIPHIMGQVLVRWALHGEPLADAVAAPRFHLAGDVLEFEEPPPSDVADALLARGYAGIEQPPSPLYFGSIQALEIDHGAGELRGVADARREGDWRVEAP